MEASFLFALSALTEWRGLMTLMSSSITTQRHTNPSMVLFCVHFLYTHKYRYSRTYKQITKDFFLYLGNNCRVFGTFQKNETIIYPIALFIHNKVTISFILNTSTLLLYQCCMVSSNKIPTPSSNFLLLLSTQFPIEQPHVM